MKRRDFLIGTAGVLGSSVPAIGSAAARPCPPSPVSVKGGTQVVAGCSSVAAEQDWLNRAGGAGVVWAHDFRLAAEVDNFRGSQNAVDLNGTIIKTGKGTDKAGTGYHTCVQGTDFIPGTSGKSLLTYAPKAFGAGKHFSNEAAFCDSVDLETKDIFPGGGQPPVRLQANQLCGLEMLGGGGWSRPFSPLTMKDGSLPPDPAASGTIPRAEWNPNDQYQLSYFGAANRGYFLHPDYGTPAQYASGHVLGNEFWIQFRIKYSAGRHQPRNDPSGGRADFSVNDPRYPLSTGKEFPPAGKLAFIHKFNGGEQTIVPISGTAGPQYWWPNNPPFRWYGKYGGMNDAVPRAANPSQLTIQPTSPWDATCLIGANGTQPNVCWSWPENEWVTLLAHIRPGRHNATVDGGNNDTLIEFKVARWGETEYTTVYHANRGVVYSKGDGNPLGYALLSLNCYYNNVPSFVRIEQIYTQVILSKQEIPCPKAY